MIEIRRVQVSDVTMPEQLEERVALLEAEVARLKRKVESDSSPTPW
ncbi:hypothetical protein IQ238_26780 [Pleurocapsales cyanobacterium LEGE 06147]|nr:hypothetical protein [Pleurocapsales cyanobacterium LEGE 06147]